MRPGFCEMDLVGHDGGSTWGDCHQSLDAEDVASGWIEARAARDQAQRWVFEAYLNFFQPQAKLMGKERVGGKVVKKYDLPKTSYQRALDFPSMYAKAKQRLKRRYAKLNPAELRRKILECQFKLYKKAAFKSKEMDTEANQEDKDFECIYL